jgi:Ca-activated chloride channel family protein
MKTSKFFLISILLVIAIHCQALAGYLVCAKGDLPLISQKIKVEIKNQVAVTKLEQIFYNPHNVTIQPNIRFPIHEKASVQGFSLTDSSGQIYEGKIEETNKATQEFNEAQDAGIMPAMSVQKQPGVFETSIGAIGPKSRATVLIEYSEILPYKSGIIDFKLPFNVSTWQRKQLDQISLQILISDQKTITKVESSSHDLYATKIDENNWQAVFERNNFLPQKDFSLAYEVKAEEMAVNFLSTRPNTEKDGYFVLMLSPQEIIEQTDIANRDIVFVVDTSGSMRRQKMQQTKEAFNFFVKRLNQNDRFGIVDFSDLVKTWKPELEYVSTESTTDAGQYIQNLVARGGTNINEALVKATSYFTESKDRTKAIIFLTDGEATNGITQTEKILSNFKEANPLNIRTFTIGVGRSVNKQLLGQLALDNRGEALYLEDRSNLDKELMAFYETISTPLLVDLELDFGDMQVSEVYPKQLPNVYRGTQLVVTGRYMDGGNTSIKLSGLLNSEKKEFDVRADFETASDENRFVSRYWAQTKANDLLKQIQSFGQNQSLKDQVIELSKTYQFATPYTSFIAVSKQQVPQAEQHVSSGRNSATYANIRRQAAPKRVVVKKKKAKSISLWGASGFVPFALAVPNFRKAREQARDKACYANMRVLLGAVEMYNMDHSEHEMITVMGEQEMDLLLKGGYLKAPLSHPEADCHYGSIGDLSADGAICCAKHGTVDDNIKGERIFSDKNGNYYTQIETKETTPWTTRIWNDYLADILSFVINVPLFLIGLAFSLYLTYLVVSLPFKIIRLIAGSIFNNLKN